MFEGNFDMDPTWNGYNEAGDSEPIKEALEELRRENKDYNILSAKIMRSTEPSKRRDLSLFELSLKTVLWNPLQDRNHAHQLLVRSLELNIGDKVCNLIYETLGCGPIVPGQYGEYYIISLLTCDPEIITKSFVDLYEKEVRHV